MAKEQQSRQWKNTGVSNPSNKMMMNYPDYEEEDRELPETPRSQEEYQVVFDNIFSMN